MSILESGICSLVKLLDLQLCVFNSLYVHVRYILNNERFPILTRVARVPENSFSAVKM